MKNNKIIEYIRTERKKLGFTQEELADRAKVSCNTIGNIETGVFSPKIDTFFKIAKALGKDFICINDFLDDLE